ncbi:MAG: family N-acetyltransferase [Chloroflexi bacterium]|jgi:GNAT superfamily N-acetyltransferase|nr:family N-acetyltransferase [Chloroflexota bacterium]
MTAGAGMTGDARWRVRTIGPADRAWLRGLLDARWGGPWQAYGGELVDASGAAGFVALTAAGTKVGVLLHRPVAGGWEIVLLDAVHSGKGIGTVLLEACAGSARSAGAARLTLVTTNDNLRALRFYQRRGFRLAALRPGAVDAARRERKPAIPEIGEDGITIRDELVLERELG